MRDMAVERKSTFPAACPSAVPGPGDAAAQRGPLFFRGAAPCIRESQGLGRPQLEGLPDGGLLLTVRLAAPEAVALARQFGDDFKTGNSTENRTAANKKSCRKKSAQPVSPDKRSRFP